MNDQNDFPEFFKNTIAASIAAPPKPTEAAAKAAITGNVADWLAEKAKARRQQPRRRR